MSLRLVGVEDGWFEPYKAGESTLICAVVMSGGSVESIGTRCIEVDGTDATGKLLELLGGITCDAVILGGISFGGFNVVDAEAVRVATGVPVIVFIPEAPDSEAMLAALCKHFPDWQERWRRVEALGEIFSEQVGDGRPIFFEVLGASRDEAARILRASSLGRIPEPVRVAKLVARGLTRSS